MQQFFDLIIGFFELFLRAWGWLFDRSIVARIITVFVALLLVSIFAVRSYYSHHPDAAKDLEARNRAHIHEEIGGWLKKHHR